MNKEICDAVHFKSVVDEFEEIFGDRMCQTFIALITHNDYNLLKLIGAKSTLKLFYSIIIRTI